MSQSLTTEALKLHKTFGIAEKEILNHDVESFLTNLVSQFSERRDTLLAEREIWKQKVDNGMLPDFYFRIRFHYKLRMESESNS